MIVGEKTWVSWATKFCARSSSPTGNPGTLAPAGESGSVVGPLLIHVAEIQSVRGREVLVQAKSELVVVLAQRLSGDESVGPVCWAEGKTAEHSSRSGSMGVKMVIWLNGTGVPKKVSCPGGIAAQAGRRD